MGKRSRTRVLRAIEAIFWWGAAFGIWLLSISALSSQELIVAACASFPCGPLAVVGRLASEHRWTIRPSWFAAAALLPIALVVDLARLFACLIKGGSGQFARKPITGASGHTAMSEGRRAVAAFLTTLTPGSYVVDIHPKSGEALLHVVSENPKPDMASAAAR